MAINKKSASWIVVFSLIGVLFYLYSNKRADNQAFVVASRSYKPSTEPVLSAPPKISKDSGLKPPMTAPSAPERMAQARKLTDVYQRGLACIKIIQELCASGDLQTAWNLLDSTPGFVRSSELAQFFKCAGLTPSQFVERIQALDSEETLLVFGSYAENFTPSSLDKALEVPSFKLFFDSHNLKYPKALSSMISNNLTTKLRDAEDSASRLQALEFAGDYHNKGMLNDNHFAAIVNEDRTKSAFEKWQMVASKVKVYERGGEAASVRKSLVEGMVYSDANRAMEEIIKEQGNRSIVDIVTAIKQWGTVDGVAVNKWYVENSGRLTAAQRDGAAVAFSKMALGHNELDGAEKWAAQILEPTMRKGMLDEIKKK